MSVAVAPGLLGQPESTNAAPGSHSTWTSDPGMQERQVGPGGDVGDDFAVVAEAQAEAGGGTLENEVGHGAGDRPPVGSSR